MIKPEIGNLIKPIGNYSNLDNQKNIFKEIGEILEKQVEEGCEEGIGDQKKTINGFNKKTD